MSVPVHVIVNWPSTGTIHIDRYSSPANILTHLERERKFVFCEDSALSELANVSVLITDEPFPFHAQTPARQTLTG